MDLSILPKIAGLTIPLAGIALPLLILWVVLHYRERQRSKLYDTVKYFADRGMPVPRELLDPPQDQRPTLGTPRFRAFTTIGTGLGVALMFAIMDMRFLIGIGGLLVFIGLAQLIALHLDAQDAEKARARQDGPASGD